MRYTFHGGGPCDGALNGAVMPDPLSSGATGQPLSAHAFATRATAPRSVTRAASPSITTSASRIDTAIEHRGSRSTLRPLRVPAPVWNQNVPSTQRAPTAVTCGLPSSLTVDSHVVREFAASGRGVDPASSFSATAAQSTGGSPSASPRFMISTSRTYLPVLRAVRRRRSTNWQRAGGSRSSRHRQIRDDCTRGCAQMLRAQPGLEVGRVGGEGGGFGAAIDLDDLSGDVARGG